MNTKATLFHWILFGILAAFGVFFVVFHMSDTLPAQGIWQTNFLQNTYFKGEEELLRTEHTVRWKSWETVLWVTSLGGVEQATSCGPVQLFPFWNKKEQWCLPKPTETFVNKVSSYLAAQFPQQGFSHVHVRGTSVVAQGKPAEIISQLGNFERYSYDTSFAVDIGYDFAEYTQIIKEAQQLVTQCAGKKLVDECITVFRTTHTYWDSNLCAMDTLSPLPEPIRQRKFCVESPSKIKLYDPQGTPQPVLYMFSLDFTTNQPLVIEDLKATRQSKDSYELTFSYDLNIEKYTIYFTNYDGVRGFSGNPKEVLILPGAGNFLEQVSVAQENVIHDEAACSSTKEAGKGYQCGSTIIYVVQSAQLLEGEEYFFAVTGQQNGLESEISHFVSG